MKAARIHQFGAPDAIVIDDLPRPVPGPGEVVVRVAAAGVGPWDALIREHTSTVTVSLPLILGSDLAGIIEAVGDDIKQFQSGDRVYGVTNPQFIGAYAEYALASAAMIGLQPASLSFTEAASVPVVAVTAWQMLFDYAKVQAGQAVLIHGAAGNVGAYAVQFAKQAGLEVFATAGSQDVDYVRSLGATTVIDYKTARFEDMVPQLDVVLDMVGGDTRDRSFRVIKPGGILVSVFSESMPENAPSDVRFVFFLVEVTSERLDKIRSLFDKGMLAAQVGTVLPLEQVRLSHEMLAGAPHKRGKIVLNIADISRVVVPTMKGPLDA